MTVFCVFYDNSFYDGNQTIHIARTFDEAVAFAEKRTETLKAKTGKTWKRVNETLWLTAPYDESLWITDIKLNREYLTPLHEV